MSRRTDVLDALRASSAPVTITQLARSLDVHPNTVRFHLDALVGTGQVERVESGPHRPGRPPQLFRAVHRMDPGGPTRYRMLAEILTRALADDADPEARALDIGRGWGRTVEAPPADSAVDSLVTVLDEFGFAPERPVTEQLRLRHCPFLGIAENNSAVVCPIHLGLMQGALENWQAPVTVDRLEPFVEPDLCLAHLTATEDNS
ncbi:helix-turn-helix domain-containing protein [Mycobacterium sp. 21AC1]|uniref:helix-turn-helix transcriptional regulator n=1 Tax=[Mycobacterium] appelbergii TaxID=2939269 RepID=UPI0029392624|nr:helix-turn-helix domain-containing protein [Mycobacterium sp. 21AC1]MDV3125137.1 helix-turn-helix domain-containing protein [Mycobacterium sp. 21AC1]